MLGLKSKVKIIWVFQKHEGVKCSDVPELVAKFNEIDEFLEYTKKYLGFEEINGEFEEYKKDLEKTQKEEEI